MEIHVLYNKCTIMKKEEILARIDELKSAKPFLSLFYKTYYKNRLQFLSELLKNLKHDKNNL